MGYRPLLVAVALLALTAPASTAEPPVSPARFELTVDSIMRGPKLVGHPPEDLRWSGDSRQLYFEWQPPGEDEPATWVVSRAGGAPRKLSDEERRHAPPADGTWDEAHRRALDVQDGDVVLIDSVTGERRQVTRTAAEESHPRWAADETHVSFVRGDGVFLVGLGPRGGDVIVQLAVVGPKKKEPELSAGQKYLEEAEKRLILHVKRETEKKETKKAEEKKRAIPRFETTEGQSLADAVLSPDGTHLFLLIREKAKKARVAMMPEYVTESAYTDEVRTRTKVGDVQDRMRLGVLGLESGKGIWASAAFAGTAPAEPAADSPSTGGGHEAKAAGRVVRWSLPQISKDGRFAVAAVRAVDNKDRWLVEVDPATGSSTVVDRWHDDAWVRWMWRTREFGFLPDQASLWLLAEHGDRLHLWRADLVHPDAEPTALTSGSFELFSAFLGPRKQRLYLVSNEPDPGERALYALPVTGGTRTRLTRFPGVEGAAVSPDGSTLGLVLSRANRPPEVFLAANRPGADPRQVTTSTTEEWRSYPWIEPRIVHFQARDGVEVPARLYTPEDVGARRDPRRPGVVFVHGAGYLQNAVRFWSSYYYREYMFDHLLASRGYVVLDVDYRGSAGYGRAWRTAIYRHMGGKDLDDIVDGARYLVDHQQVDPRRVGIWGGSYGGFMTLMAMFTRPAVFAAGAALRPVTDWAHYNHPYTSAILNLPQDDPEAYRRSSPIEFADGLRGTLLICHGMVDRNVHFQDTVRLVQRLIELRKRNWELAVYPVENHGFEEETSWADEYRRILTLFERHLRSDRGEGPEPSVGGGG